MAEGDVIIACQQERPRFEALAAEIGVAEPGFVDLRDRAGWGEGPAAPKMAALAAEATMPLEMGRAVDIVSEGTCLILGGSAAIEAAAQLSDTLAVTVLLGDPALVVGGWGWCWWRCHWQTASGQWRTWWFHGQD